MLRNCCASKNVQRSSAANTADRSAPPPASPPRCGRLFRGTGLRRRRLRAGDRNPKPFVSQLGQRRPDHESLPIGFGLEQGRAAFVCRPALPAAEQEKGCDRLPSSRSAANSDNPLHAVMVHGRLLDRDRIGGLSIPQRPRRLGPSVPRARAVSTRSSGFTSTAPLIRPRARGTRSGRYRIRPGRYQAF